MCFENMISKDSVYGMCNKKCVIRFFLKFYLQGKKKSKFILFFLADILI